MPILIYMLDKLVVDLRSILPRNAVVNYGQNGISGKYKLKVFRIEYQAKLELRGNKELDETQEKNNIIGV